MPILLSEFASGLWKGDPLVALPGSQTAQPPGLEALIEYNEIIIHDRKVVDKYRVLTLDGLHGGVDIRFNEEINPGDHGATPLGNLLGGRTFMIEGEVQAHNIGKLRDMEQALRTSFMSTIERPMIFHVGDANRDVYIMCRANDKIGLKDEQVDTNAFRKFLITMRASNPRIYSVNSRTYRFTLGLNDDFTGGVAGWTIDSGTAYSVTSNQLNIPTAVTRSTRNDLGYKIYDSRETIKVVAPATITNGDQIGVRVKEVDDANYVWCRLRATSATAGVLEVVKTVAGVDTTLTATASLTLAGGTTYWLQPSIVGNLVTIKLFSTDPTPGPGTQVGATGSYTLAVGAEQTAFGTLVAGSVGLRTVSTNAWKGDDFEVEPLRLNNQVITPRHAGNFLALPQVALTGPMTDVQLVNETLMPDESFQRFLKINGTIPAGRTYTYDASAGTLVDDLGARKDSQLDVSTRQLQLANGDNLLTLVAASSSGTTPAVAVTLQDTWV